MEHLDSMLLSLLLLLLFLLLLGQCSSISSMLQVCERVDECLSQLAAQNLFSTTFVRVPADPATHNFAHVTQYNNSSNSNNNGNNNNNNNKDDDSSDLSFISSLLQSVPAILCFRDSVLVSRAPFYAYFGGIHEYRYCTSKYPISSCLCRLTTLLFICMAFLLKNNGKLF